MAFVSAFQHGSHTNVGGLIDEESIWDLFTYREEIIALLKTGSTKTYLARKYETSLPNFYNWLKKNKIAVEAEL